MTAGNEKPDECRCFLPLKPPESGDWCRPDIDEDPGRPWVNVVVRYDEDPSFRRAVRLRDGSGWVEKGAGVAFYEDITPPMPWKRVGTCWAEIPHPVVPVHLLSGGTWAVGAL